MFWNSRIPLRITISLNVMIFPFKQWHYFSSLIDFEKSHLEIVLHILKQFVILSVYLPSSYLGDVQM